MKKTLVVGFLAVLMISLLVLPAVSRVLDECYGSEGSRYRNLPTHIQLDWKEPAGAGEINGSASAGSKGIGQGGNARMTPC
jgi:hypothetical protein